MIETAFEDNLYEKVLSTLSVANHNLWKVSKSTSEPQMEVNIYT